LEVAQNQSSEEVSREDSQEQREAGRVADMIASNNRIKIMYHPVSS
jgi:hypothetical protein